MTWELLLVIVVIAMIAGLGFAYVRSRTPGGG
jgi:Tfp pilus assembly protein FimT